jgi:hypothetical protein
MIVIRQSTLRTSIAASALVVAFTVMGVYALVQFESKQGRSAAIALLVVAGVLAFVSVRSITRGGIVGILYTDGLELRGGHFARWGRIRWNDVDEVFLFRSIGLQMIGLRLSDPQRYLRRSPPWVRWSLWLDRHLAAGADAYLSRAAARPDPMDLARLLRVFQHSPALRERFGREDLVLEFPTDIDLAEILSASARPEQNEVG